MKILVFTEGTILMHSSGKGLSREEIVKQSKSEGVQGEEGSIEYNSMGIVSKTGSVHDYCSSCPIGGAYNKLKAWKSQGADICYLTSRRIKSEIEAIKSVLGKFDFPGYENLFFRKKGEDYKDVAERLAPDIIVEDDCESIGGEVEMVYQNMRQDLKAKTKSIVVKEFGGIDHLPDSLAKLGKYESNF